MGPYPADRETRLRILDGIARMSEAPGLDPAIDAMVETAVAVMPCENAAYTEIDPYLGRNLVRSSRYEVTDWAVRRADELKVRLPEHPGIKFRFANPHLPTMRLSDVTDMGEFHRSGLYIDLLRETGSQYQMIMQFGFQPGGPRQQPTFPVAIGLAMNRSGRDFSDRDMAILTSFRNMVMPILMQKRAAHLLALLDRVEMTPELVRLLMGHGLSERQAEVAFWMLKGKSNTDTAAILDIGADTVRHHSIAIFRRLGVDGRLSLQRTIMRSMIEH